MRVLGAVSLGGAGHIGPLRPWLDAARAAGHQVRVVGPAALAPLVEPTGHAFVAGGEPPEELIAPIREQLPVVPAAQASVLGNRELFGRLAARALLPDVEALCADWRPDLILRDPCEYASAAVAMRNGLATAQVAISLAAVEAGSIEAAAPALDDLEDGLTEWLRATPYLTRFPASLDPSPFACTVRVREPIGSSRPLPDWWPGRAARPLVHVTFGTVLGHMTHAADVFRVLLAAVRELDARVLLTVGTTFDASALDAPSHVHIEPWIDQADVFAQASLVVCHGGSGTVFGALDAGVPLVVVPIFADQFANGRLIDHAGAGCCVESGALVGMSDATRIRAAIDAVLTTPAYRHRAAQIAAAMRACPPVDQALAELLAGALSRRGRPGS